MVEQIILHEIAVALIVGGGQPYIFVQVYRVHLGKAQIPLPVPLHQLLVGPDGGGAGGQTQHTVRLGYHLGCDDGGRPAAHGVVILLTIDSHGNTLRHEFFGWAAFQATGIPFSTPCLAAPYHTNCIIPAHICQHKEKMIFYGFCKVKYFSIPHRCLSARASATALRRSRQLSISRRHISLNSTSVR